MILSDERTDAKASIEPSPSENPSRGRPRRRRLWIVVASVIAVAVIVGSIVLVTQPPAPPFQQKWSRTVAGNPSGEGAGADGAYLTFSSTTTRSLVPPYSVNASVSMQSINASTGKTVWSSAPLVLVGDEFVQPEVLAGTSVAVLVVTSASLTSGNLSVLAANISTGSTLGMWSEPLPEWSAILSPNVQVGLYNTTLVTLVPLELNATLPLRIQGVDLLSGGVQWTTSTNLTGDVGWGSGSSRLSVSGTNVIAVVTTNGTTDYGGVILVVSGQNGTIRFERDISGPSNLIGGVSDLDAFYYLSNSTGEIEIQGIELTNGTTTKSIGVTTVADDALLSAQLYSVSPLLILASYSPSPSYGAYAANGSLVWTVQLPDATSCGTTVEFPELGPCATALWSPLAYDRGTEVLLDSGPFLLSRGTPYHNAYRLVSLSRGEVVWSTDYLYTFGEAWPWSSPVPNFTVTAVVGNEIIYTVQTPDSTDLAGGVL